MQTKAALIIGGTSGIGRQICLKFASKNFNVGVASKITENTGTLRSTVYSVAKEVENLRVKALPLVCDARNERDVTRAVRQSLSEFGSLDVLVYNAGAVFRNEVLETPLERYDTMNEVNARGALCAVQAVGQHMLDRNTGTIILISPPIYSRFFNRKTAYAMTKVGMTVLMHGFANEIKDTGVSISSLWPATLIKSQATTVMQVPDRMMRRPAIMGDACAAIPQADPKSVNGASLVDEDFLRSMGQLHFDWYRCDAKHEPPRMMPARFPDLRFEGREKTSPPKK